MRLRLPALVLLVLLAAVLLPATASAAPSTQNRYTLANGCFALSAPGGGGAVGKDGNGGYKTGAAQAEGFRMKATALGHYLFFGKSADFMAANPSNDVRTVPDPSDRANWQVDQTAGGFKISLPSAGKALTVGDGGQLVLGDGSTFTFAGATGCAAFPEADTDAVGEPTKGASAYGQVRGLLDAHMHMMAFEFLGGRAHCGKPWSPFGAPDALVDCPDHYPNGAGALLENTVSYGNPIGTHDPVGWPTFKDWPNPQSLTHENSYYKWVERAWRGGLRTYVNLLVENKVLCEVYWLKKNSCDEMDAVRLQAKDIYELQDYIDAQYGGPGKGWFRIVTDPFEARRVINEGKLAVVLGIEVSEPFGCQEFEGRPMCDEAKIDAGLDEVYKLGVRDMEIVNKFDNALAGVAGDNGTTGLIVNQGNKLETGNYWQMQTCKDKPEGVNDRTQPTPFTHNDDALLANGLQAALGAGATPLYPPAPHCNARGLTPLGEHLIRKMMEKRMIVDPDHLSVLAREQVMALLEEQKYPGAVSSHSWSTKDAYPRIYNLGGVIAPYAGNSETFVESWKAIKPMVPAGKFTRTTTECTVNARALRRPSRRRPGRRGGRRHGPAFTGKVVASGAASRRTCKPYVNDVWGIGYGADMNGFGHQGSARLGAKNPVRYPFKSFDGHVTLDHQVTGKRVWDINKDGVANYGLFPDWVEDLRMIAGDQIVKDLSKGSEAYLEMWERTEGVPDSHCLPERASLSSVGLGGARVSVRAGELLRTAGQPAERGARVWRYCATGQGGRVTTVLSPGGVVGLVASTASGHSARGVAAGESARALGASWGYARRGTLVRRAGAKSSFVYGVRYGIVSFVAVAPRSVAGRPAKLRSYLKLAGLG
jgi:microsomal dipeptidase-like Zn-dependent dipeptidase